MGAGRGLPPTVLAVDDCEELLEWLKIDLSTRGFDVRTATGGEEALTIVAGEPIDLMVLDVMMPGSRKFAEFVQRHPRYARCQARLDTGIMVRQESRALDLASLGETHRLCPPLIRAPDTGRPAPLQPAAALVELAGDPAFRARHGDLRLYFDGLTVCQLITSSPDLPRSPVVYLFTAGGLGPRGERQQKALQVGARAYVLKSEYYDRLLPLLEHHLDPREGASS